MKGNRVVPGEFRADNCDLRYVYNEENVVCRLVVIRGRVSSFRVNNVYSFSLVDEL